MNHEHDGPVRPNKTLLATVIASSLAAWPAAAQVGAPAGPVPVELLGERRARLMAALDGAPVVVGASRLRDLEREYPQDSDFRQSNDFFYLTGLETPEAWLVLNLPDPGAEVLYVAPRDPSQERWTGRKLGPDAEAARRSGVADVRSSAGLATDVNGWLRESGAEVVYVDPGDPAHVDRLDEALTGLEARVESSSPTVADLRMIKDEDELRRLREAVRITAEAHQEAWRAAGPGIHEYEIEAVIEYVFRSQGAERVGFPSIVGSAENSVTLHYDKNRRKLEDGDVVVVDIGAEFGYYTADLTRTFPVSGRFTDRQRAVYELVLGAQEAALATVRPGATVGHLEQAARRYMAEHSADLCGGRSCAAYFPHGVSHWLGMDVHDVGSYGTTLEPGMVLTIEPGIYLADENLGIRIEDNVLVTEEGYELLSESLPRRPEEVERIMSESRRIGFVAGQGS